MDPLAEFQKQVQQLADDLASIKVEAAFHAWNMMIVDVYKLLMEKGLLTKDELAARMAHIENIAATTREVAPSVSDFTMSATLAVRNAFGMVSKTSN